jgi:hypothetical protein
VVTAPAIAKRCAMQSDIKASKQGIKSLLTDLDTITPDSIQLTNNITNIINYIDKEESSSRRSSETLGMRKRHMNGLLNELTSDFESKTDLSKLTTKYAPKGDNSTKVFLDSLDSGKELSKLK